MRSTTPITIVALALLLSAGTLVARPPAGGHGAARGAGPGTQIDGNAPRGARGPALLAPRFLVRYLELSEQQVEETKALFEAHRDAVRPLHRELRDLHRELRGLLEGEDPDASAVGELVLEGKVLKDELRTSREVFHGDLRALLTTDQQKRWDILLEIVEILRSPGPAGPSGTG